MFLSAGYTESKCSGNKEGGRERHFTTYLHSGQVKRQIKTSNTN